MRGKKTQRKSWFNTLPLSNRVYVLQHVLVFLTLTCKLKKWSKLLVSYCDNRSLLNIFTSVLPCVSWCWGERVWTFSRHFANFLWVQLHRDGSNQEHYSQFYRQILHPFTVVKHSYDVYKTINHVFVCYNKATQNFVDLV